MNDNKTTVVIDGEKLEVQMVTLGPMTEDSLANLLQQPIDALNLPDRLSRLLLHNGYENVGSLALNQSWHSVFGITPNERAVIAGALAGIGLLV